MCQRKMKLVVFAILTLAITSSINCSRSVPGALPSSGVPCYLHPSQDECHYKLKPGSITCTRASDRKQLNRGILLVNRTLASLEQQLIRLGVIPPDNACSKLPDVENGGIIYDDLNLGSGATGRYICDEGYSLHLFQSRHVFTCTEDGIWDGNVTTVPVQCLLSAARCDFPEEILNGTIIFTDNNTANIMVGDAIAYNCAVNMKLHGPRERVCMKTGNWSGSQPQCVELDSNGDVPRNDSIKKSTIIGASVGSVMGVLLISLLVILLLLIVVVHRAMRKRKQAILNFDDDDIDKSIVISQ